MSCARPTGPPPGGPRQQARDGPLHRRWHGRRQPPFPWVEAPGSGHIGQGRSRLPGRPSPPGPPGGPRGGMPGPGRRRRRRVQRSGDGRPCRGQASRPPCGCRAVPELCWQRSRWDVFRSFSPGLSFTFFVLPAESPLIPNQPCRASKTGEIPNLTAPPFVCASRGRAAVAYDVFSGGLDLKDDLKPILSKGGDYELR